MNLRENSFNVIWYSEFINGNPIFAVFLSRLYDNDFEYQKFPLPKICHTYPTMMKLDTVIPYLTFFHRKTATFAILRNTHIDCILIYNESL